MEEEKLVFVEWGKDVVNEGNVEDAGSRSMKTDGVPAEKGIDEFGDFHLETSNGETSSTVGFSRKAPPIISAGCTCKSLARPDSSNKEKDCLEKKLTRLERVELCRLFQGAVSSHDWERAENLVLLADPHTLNDALCIALDCIWFLSTHEQLHGITELIRKIIYNGAYDFTRAALRTSFLASCVSACQSRTMSLSDTVTVMAQRQVLCFIFQLDLF